MQNSKDLYVVPDGRWDAKTAHAKRFWIGGRDVSDRSSR